MEAAVKKLLKRLEEIEREEWKLRRERDSIRIALTVVGVTPQKDGSLKLRSKKETDYRLNHPFAKTTLTDACLTVLRDRPDDRLNKNQVEYLVVRGAYPFNTEDTTNSVHTTLRRLSAKGKIDAKRVHGSQGNTYRYIGEKKDDIKDARTTSG